MIVPVGPGTHKPCRCIPDPPHQAKAGSSTDAPGNYDASHDNGKECPKCCEGSGSGPLPSIFDLNNLDFDALEKMDKSNAVN